MFRPTKGTCKQCRKDNKIIANKRGICVDCVYRNNHEGKSPLEVRKEKHRTKKPISRKPTGERELFIEIWKERPHYCNNCCRWLGNEPKAHFFSHIKSKGAYPELRLVKKNIELLCIDCHYIWDFGDRGEFYKRRKNNERESN